MACLDLASARLLARRVLDGDPLKYDVAAHVLADVLLHEVGDERFARFLSGLLLAEGAIVLPNERLPPRRGADREPEDRHS